jgi:phosphoserine phosphatase RsbU/P
LLSFLAIVFVAIAVILSMDVARVADTLPDEARVSVISLSAKIIAYLALLFFVVIGFIYLYVKELRHPSEALVKANDQLKAQSAAMKSAANGIIITDPSGIVKWVNPAFTALTGYEFGDIVGNNLKMLNSGMQSKEFFQNMWTKILAGEVWHDEVVNRRKDGSLYTEEMTITPVYDNQGKISQFVAIKHDITERKRLEQVVKSANERMEGELNVAKDIQMSMLPLKFPAFPERDDIDVYARLIPAREVGGDFYDFFFIDEENFCFVVGDVSGKGVPAALFMAVAKVLIKAAAGSERSTAKILARVNNEISRDNENSMFVTVFIAILNTTTGHLVYSNAGHNPSFVLRKEVGNILKLSELHGLVLGAFEGVEYRETLMQLQRGDALFAYTDGVTEAQDVHRNLYSDGRLNDLLIKNPFFGCKDLVDIVLDDVMSFGKNAEQADDITLLALHFREQTADSLVDLLFATITNDLDNIAKLIDQFEEFATKHRIPVEIIQKINIVFDELLNNTISYAFKDQQVHEIEIKIRFYKEKLIVTIMDDGIPYNPFNRMDPDISLGLDDREIGGLGVHLVKLLVDDYHYEYKDQIKKNITSFKKQIK